MANRLIAHLRDSLFLNSYLLIAMRTLTTVFGFLFWALAARTMTTENVGLASGAISASLLLAGLAQFGLGYGVVRFLPRSEKPNELLNLATVIVTLAGLVIALIFLTNLEILSPELLPVQGNLLNTSLFIILVIGTGLSVLTNWMFIATRRTIFSLTRQTSHMILALLLLLVLVPLMSDLTAVLVAHTVAVVLSVILSYHVLPKAQIGYRFSVVGLKAAFVSLVRAKFVKYSLTNHVTDQFQKSPTTLLPLIVIDLLGPSEAAYFFVVWMIGAALPPLVGGMSQSLFAEGANDPAKASYHAKRALKLGLLLISGMVLVVLLAGKLILAIYGPDYVTRGLYLLYFMTLGAIPRVMFLIFMGFLRVQDRMKAVVILIAMDSLLILLLSYMGILFYGLTGAGIGWLVSQIIIITASVGWWQWQRNRVSTRVVSTPHVDSKADQTI